MKLNFHADDVIPSPFEQALFHILPIPLEQSVSYGSGTSKAPKAIIEASAQLELFDGKNIPADLGIYTYDFIKIDKNINQTLKNIKLAVGKSLEINKIPVSIGGEHTVTLGAVEAFAEKYDDFGIIQFDAHADLRNKYEGNIYSHACVMRRIFERNIPILQIGTRSYSIEEHNFRIENKIPFFNADNLYIKPDSFQLPKNFPKNIYITFDIDALDSSIMPATGTPVPGGLIWHQTMLLLEKIINEKNCIGFDVVEFAPIKNMHAFDFAASQLIYNIMGFISRTR